MSVDVPRYLERLGLSPSQAAPSVAGLHAVHRAHVERVTYEAIDVHLGRVSPLDPGEAAARILAGRGGYCYHLNGAFSRLLAALGYDVTWHRAAVQNHGVPSPGIAWANHLALTVDLGGELWLADVGLGDALHDPLPLRPGTYRQGPFTYRLDHSTLEPGGWRFDHDPRGTFAGMDFSMAPATLADFEERHHYLQTSPESPYLRACAVIRRDATGVDNLTGCVLRRTDGSGKTERELSTAGEWFGVLSDTFGLPLADLDPADRSALWTRIRAAHEVWLAGRPS
jgi:arylamine N-acetyltransferase